MALFKKFATEGVEKATDSLGGSKIESDIYKLKIAVAYLGKSDGGATSVNLVGKLNDTLDYRETIWITNKNGENFYVKNDKKFLLPGFITIDDICQITTGKGLVDLEDSIEDKTVKIYDFEARKEMPKEVQVIAELNNVEVCVAIQRTLEDKTAKADNGDYVPTGETVERTNIEKAFDPDTMLTVVEATDGKEAGEFHTAWLEKNKGKVRDRTDKKAAKTGAPAASGNAAAPKKSLFGKK